MNKTVEIYFKDLTEEAQVHVLKTFETAEGKENWDIAPLAVLERENGEEIEQEERTAVTVDRVENWKKFSCHMEKYIEEKTISKYGMKNSGLDLMTISNPIVCIWNVIKYALRIWNGRMKKHDIEKIAHYSELAWTLSEGKVIDRITINN